MDTTNYNEKLATWLAEVPRLSYSGLNIFLHCRRRWAYVYLDQLQPKGQKAYPLQVGDIVHRLLALYHSGALAKERLATLEEWVNELYPNNEEGVSTDVAYEAIRLLRGYFNRFQNDHLTFIAHEVQLEQDFGEFILTGRADALARDKDNTLWRVETKTAARIDSGYLFGLKNGLQNGIYTYLTRKLINNTIKGTIFDLLIKTKIPNYLRNRVQYNPHHIETTLETIHGVFADIKRDNFYCSHNCYTYNRECDFRKLCEYNSPAIREAFYQPRKKEGTNDADLTLNLSKASN